MTSPRTARALARGLVLALVAALALLGWRAPAAFAEDAASCQASGGVYFYIQPGGGGCSHAGGNGMADLRGLTSVNTNSTGMICQIGGYPGTCPDPVPADDYWAYWFWSGSTWTYAQVGAASDWPEPGSVRAWTFGNGVRPTVTPPKPSSPATTSTPPATSPATSHTVRATPAPTTTAPTTLRASTAPAPRATSPRTPRPTASASASRIRTPSPTPTSPASVPTRAATPVAVTGAAPASASTDGTPWGVVATAGLLVVGGAGIAVARRRR